LKQVADSFCLDGSGYLHGTTIRQKSCDLVTVPSLPRGRIVAGNFSASMPAAFSGLGRLVKVSLTIGAIMINSRAMRPPPEIQLHHHIIMEILVRLAFVHEERERMIVSVQDSVRASTLLFSCNQTLHTQNVSFSMVAALISSKICSAS